MNTQQQNRFQKVGMESFYLLDLSKNATGNLVLEVSGSTANVYQTTIYPKSKTIFCSCPDCKSWAKSHGCACKHICFILSKVFKIPLSELISDFFDKKLIFSDKLMTMILQKYEALEAVSLGHQEFVNQDFLEKFQQMKLVAPATASTTTTTPKPVVNKYAVKKDLDEEEELECMICYDVMQKDNSIECPLCHNLVHKGCMEKWLASGKKNCIYCRSDVWKDYGTKPVTSSVSNNPYKNLLDN